VTTHEEVFQLSKGGKYGNPAHGHRARHLKRGARGKSINYPALYDHLRAKGYTKRKAAMISNGVWRKRRGKAPKSARGIVGLAKSDIDMLNKIQQETDWCIKHDSPSSTVTNNKGVMMTTINKDDLPQEVVDYIDALEDTVDEQDSQIEKMAASGSALPPIEDDADLAVILEKADPAVRAVLQKQAEQLKANEIAIAKAATDDIDRTMIAKAAALPNLTVSGEDLTQILKDAYGVSAEHGEKIENLLKAANEQVEASDMFRELGANGTSTVSASVESAASAIRKDDPTLTAEQALAKAYESNPALYNESLKGN